MKKFEVTYVMTDGYSHKEHVTHVEAERFASCWGAVTSITFFNNPADSEIDEPIAYFNNVQRILTVTE